MLSKDRQIAELTETVARLEQKIASLSARMAKEPQ